MAEKDSVVRVINNVPPSTTDIIPGVELSKRLQKSMLKLKGAFIKDDGKSVDYSSMKTSPEFTDYKRSASDLRRVDLAAMGVLERKVFFLNMYNALTIHGLQEMGDLPDSVLGVTHFFKTTAYFIGDQTYTLDDIEHGILRGNSAHPASTTPQFPPGDARLPFVIPNLDPRIHFALVCGAKSCPAIGVYTVENIDKALDAATRSFCSQEVECRTAINQVYLSKLFQWYRADFGETEVDVLKWIMPYLGPTESDRCSILIMKLEKLGPVALTYKPYDWSLNKT